MLRAVVSVRRRVMALTMIGVGMVPMRRMMTTSMLPRGMRMMVVLLVLLVVVMIMFVVVTVLVFTARLVNRPKNIGKTKPDSIRLK